MAEADVEVDDLLASMASHSSAAADFVQGTAGLSVGDEGILDDLFSDGGGPGDHALGGSAESSAAATSPSHGEEEAAALPSG